MRDIIFRLRQLALSSRAAGDDDQTIAERQATLFLRLCGVAAPPVSESIVASLPGIIVHEIASLPQASEIHLVKKRTWLLLLDGSEPLPWRRWTIMHAFKHVIDHPISNVARADSARAERIADFFAACVLMPREMVLEAWESGMHEIGALAGHFEVSLDAMRRRLEGLGLIARRRRHPQEISA